MALPGAMGSEMAVTVLIGVRLVLELFPALLLTQSYGHSATHFSTAQAHILFGSGRERSHLGVGPWMPMNQATGTLCTPQASLRLPGIQPGWPRRPGSALRRGLGSGGRGERGARLLIFQRCNCTPRESESAGCKFGARLKASPKVGGIASPNSSGGARAGAR